MLPPVSPVDLEALDAYLLSDRSPPDCMDIAQLDGFLTGVVLGPDPVLPSEFLPVVWGGATPEFGDAAAEQVMGAILGRYNEIADGLAADPAACAPVFVQGPGGVWITEDWAVGFMQAVGLRPDAWEPALLDDEGAALLVPIGLIAGMAEPSVGLHDASLPEAYLDELMERAADVIPECVLGLRAYWLERAARAVDDGTTGAARRH